MTTVVVTVESGVLAGLRSVGLTDYESRVFVALLSGSGRWGFEGMTGYEVAKRSGVPRAKVYEVLRSLVDKGGALTDVRGGRDRYFAVDPGELLRRDVEQATRRAAELGPALDRLRGEGPPRVRLETVEGYDRVLAAVDGVCGRAVRRLFALGLPKHLSRAAESLKVARRRGVLVFVVSYGSVELDVERVFVKHPVSDDEPVDSGVQWLTVVADNVEAVIGQPAPEPTESAIWTTMPTLAATAGELVRQQVMGTELFRLLDERAINLNPELAGLQAMWFNDRVSR
ncbi:TrmB family transcriptional regulator [Microlunatus endophyticus]